MLRSNQETDRKRWFFAVSQAGIIKPVQSNFLAMRQALSFRLQEEVAAGLGLAPPVDLGGQVWMRVPRAFGVRRLSALTGHALDSVVCYHKIAGPVWPSRRKINLREYPSTLYPR